MGDNRGGTDIRGRKKGRVGSGVPYETGNRKKLKKKCNDAKEFRQKLH